MKLGASEIDTSDRFWTATTVAAVMDTKKEQRQKKGRESNCFALRFYDTDAPDDTPEESRFELDNFLKNLKDSIDEGNFSGNNIETNRFQLLVQNGAHWTPLDITIRDDQLHIISMDAAASPSEMDSLNAIKKYFPTTTFYSLGTQCAVQMDNNSCSRFALDTAFKIQNIDDPISLLEGHKAETPKKLLGNLDANFKGKEYLLAPKDIPNEMSFLFRNAQSGTAISKLPDRLLDSPVNKKNVSLRDYAENHTQTELINGTQKKRYKAIETVKSKLSENTQKHVESLSDVRKSQIREQAKGIDYITSSANQRAQMNKTQKQAIPMAVKKVALAKEHIRNVPRKKGFFSSFSQTNKGLKKSRKIVSKAVVQSESNDLEQKTPNPLGKDKKRKM